jgi:hypothetical protein
MSKVPGRDQIKTIYDLLKQGVKFKYNGGTLIRDASGRTFQKKHYDAAKQVIKIQKKLLKDPHAFDKPEAPTPETSGGHMRYIEPGYDANGSPVE